MAQTFRPAAVGRAAVIAAAALLGACSFLSSSTPPKLYVLGDPASAATASEERGRPLLVRTVTIPEYLDNRDIMIRSGDNVLTVSETGQWGERLSVGITRGLVTALATRTERPVLANDSDRAGRAQDLIIDIETFDVRADGSVVLVARWQVYDPDRRRTVASERVVLDDRAATLADEDVVGAMSRLIGRLADGIAAKV